MEQFEKGPKTETPEEHINNIRRMITEAGITEGSLVIISTKSHPKLRGDVRSMRLEEEDPYLLADLRPMRNVRVDLKSIISIEKEKAENPQ